jgi:hypothetical protein
MPTRLKFKLLIACFQFRRSSVATGKKQRRHADFPLPLRIESAVSTLSPEQQDLCQSSWIQLIRLFTRIKLISLLQGCANIISDRPVGEGDLANH